MVLVPPVYDDIQLLDRVKTALKPCHFGFFSVTTAEEHDKMIAFTSQMPHILSNAFIKSPTALKHKGFSAGSYKDLTRVAWLNPQMWAELFMENKDNVLFELDSYIESLSAYRDAIAANDMAGPAAGRGQKAQRGGGRMNTVTVRASKQYDILIGQGLLPTLGAEAKKLGKAQKICVVSESNVYPLYGAAVEESMKSAGFSVVSYVFPAGEESKNGQVFLDLLNFLAENQLTRSDLIVALGGGVVGDLAGFAAASYLRGIRFIQVPTTLLAAVDSSVGGKTAIDLPVGKNLAGAFCQPSLVLCDTDTLNSLPLDIFRDGCAEVIKYGVLYDPKLFAHLEEKGLSFDREAVITRCMELKRDVVMEDEFDTGVRMKLNLGHTVGHGVEAKSHFAISHGKAVAIGMAIVSRASACADTPRIVALLEQFGLPTRTDYSADDLFSYTLSDKKRSGGTVNLIIPRAIGDCAIVPTKVESLKSFIQAGL